MVIPGEQESSIEKKGGVYYYCRNMSTIIIMNRGMLQRWRKDLRNASRSHVPDLQHKVWLVGVAAQRFAEFERHTWISTL
jgi:hypothetical protein